MTNTVIENGITLYFHCQQCLKGNETSKLAVGWTKKGIQVWCENHNTNLIALDFNGQKVVNDVNPKEAHKIEDN